MGRWTSAECVAGANVAGGLDAAAAVVVVTRGGSAGLGVLFGLAVSMGPSLTSASSMPGTLPTSACRPHPPVVGVSSAAAGLLHCWLPLLLSWFPLLLWVMLGPHVPFHAE